MSTRFAGLVAASISLFASPLVAQERLSGWHHTLERAQAAARDSGKPLFVVFRCVR